MAQVVELPGNRVVEFPDGMSEEDMEREILRGFPDLRKAALLEESKEIEREEASFRLSRLGLRAALGVSQGVEQLKVAAGATLAASQRPVDYFTGVGAAQVGDTIAAEARKERDELAELGRDIGGGTAGEVAQGLSSMATSIIPTIPGAVVGRAVAAASGVSSAIGAVIGGATASGVQSFGATYDEAKQAYLDQGMTEQQANTLAYGPATLSGVITAGITAAFGATGIEAVNPAVALPTVRAIVLRALREGGMEGREEMADQIAQSIVQKATYNPEKTLTESVKETLMAGAGGFVLGGGMQGLNYVSKEASDKINALVDEAQAQNRIKQSAADWANAYQDPAQAQERATIQREESPFLFNRLPPTPQTETATEPEPAPTVEEPTPATAAAAGETTAPVPEPTAAPEPEPEPTPEPAPAAEEPRLKENEFDTWEYGSRVEWIDQDDGKTIRTGRVGEIVKREVPIFGPHAVVFDDEGNSYIVRKKRPQIYPPEPEPPAAAPTEPEPVPTDDDVIDLNVEPPTATPPPEEKPDYDYPIQRAGGKNLGKWTINYIGQFETKAEAEELAEALKAKRISRDVAQDIVRNQGLDALRLAAGLAKPTATPIPEPVEAGSDPAEEFFKVDVTEDPAAREAAKFSERQVAELEQQRSKLAEERNAIGKEIVSTRRPNKGRIKTTAPRAKVTRYQELAREIDKLTTQAEAIRRGSAKDRLTEEQSMLAKRVKDPKLPRLHRLGARVRMFAAAGEKVPAELSKIFKDAADAEVKKRFPDVRPKELERLSHEMERAAMLQTDIDREIEFNPIFKLADARRQELEAAITGPTVPLSSFSQEAKEKIFPHTTKDRPSEFYGRPVEPLTGQQIDELVALVKSESDRLHKKFSEDAAKAQAERAAEEAKVAKLLVEAQEEADSAKPEAGKKPKRSAKEIKEELIKRIEKAIDDTLAASKVKLTKREDGLYVAENEENSVIAFGEIRESEKGNLTAVAWRSNVRPSEDKVSIPIDNVAEGEWVIKAMAAEATGKVIIGVPGDGVFQLLKSGRTLLQTLRGAMSIETSGQTKPKKYTAPDKKIEINQVIEDALTVYGDARTAVARLEANLASDAEIHPDTRFAVERALERLRMQLPEIKLDDQITTAKRALDDAESVIKIAEERLRVRRQAGGRSTMADQRFAEEQADLIKDAKSKLPGLRMNLAQLQRERAKYDKPLAESLGTSRRRPKFDIFEADEGDLADYFDEQFGEQSRSGSPGAFGRAGKFTFRTYDEFKAWMADRYTEFDLEGMRLAFAEADTATKVRYCKEARNADPHFKAWVSHLATGSPLPPENPPVPRTTPRPMPGQPPPRPGAPRGPSPGPTPPKPGRPQPPPPPPRPTPNTPHHRKFSITALIQLARRISAVPTVNTRLTRTLGRFMPATNTVEIKQRLLWDTKLAERVIGHEIGHFIDLVIPIVGKGKQFAYKLKPLEDFRGQMWKAKDLRNFARDLSRDWRGPFLNGDRYRDTAVELFADFMSAMFNNPEWVNQQYPVLFDAFRELRDGKPQFASAYREIETWLQGGTMAQELRAQDRNDVTRTLDILENAPDRSRASWEDRLHFATVSLWGRARQREGDPTELGTFTSEELEYSRLWAAKENALFADNWKKQVEPFLEQVDPDPIAARTALHSYSKARRTISEVRAGGLWIRQNPTEARQLLEKILAADPTLKSKWIGALNNAGPDELYDLSAAIFRDIHDRGDRFVARMGRVIDNLHLGIEGEVALLAFNVRGKMANPGGLTPETAAEMLTQMQDELGPARYAALETAAENMRDLLFENQAAMHAEGLISDKMWDELIAPNRDNYVPYAVLDYFEGYVRAGVMKQIGTFKDVADVSVATQLKVAANNAWRQSQRQVQLVRAAWQAGGTPVPIGEALQRSADIDRIRAQHLTDDISRAVLWVDGTPHLIELPGDQGKLIEKAMDNPAFFEHMQWIVELTGLTHSVMQIYTQFSVPFMFWSNPIRGFRTVGLKVGFKEAAKQVTFNFLENYRMARNYSQAAFGGEMSPEIRQLVDNQVLAAPRLSRSLAYSQESLRQMMENHGILAFQLRNYEHAQPRWWTGGALGQKAIRFTERVFTTYEAFEKIYAYQAALSGGAVMEKARSIARRSGIPNVGVGGKWSAAMEIWFPWSRVHIQGTRSTLDMLADPTTRKGFVTRFMLTEALPRVAKIAIAMGVISGVIKWAFDDDEEKKDETDHGPMAEFFRRVSPYKMALSDTIPLCFYDARTGKYHPIWSFKTAKEIPAHFEAVSIRVPSSEEGRLWGVLLYDMMTSAPGSREFPNTQETLGKPGTNPITALGGWAVNYLAPGLSPIIKTGDTLIEMIAKGKNPVDPFRDQPSANPRLFDAGGVERAQAIAGYTMNQMGSIGELGGWLASNFGVLDRRALNAMSRRLPMDQATWYEKLPFLKAMVAHDNYATFRTEKAATLAEEQLRTRANLLMSDEVRALYTFYYQNQKRQDKLTGSEAIQFDHAKQFVQKVWGNMTDEHSFYGKAAHAAGPDGSAEAKETVTRDLDTRAAPFLEGFKAARMMEQKEFDAKK